MLNNDNQKSWVFVQHGTRNPHDVQKQGGSGMLRTKEEDDKYMAYLCQLNFFS